MLMRALFGTLAALSLVVTILLVVLLAWHLHVPNFGSASSSPSPSPKATPSPFAFKVTIIPSHFRSTLPLIAAYEVAIPADRQWHDTKIGTQPRQQMLINYLRGTSGHVQYLIGKRSRDISLPLGDQSWYEHNFIEIGKNDAWNTVVSFDSTLKVRSLENNVYLRVEIRNKN
jgi:hypothetical protein